MNKMKSSQAGFTLIELVVVIVILGILAATALPKFVDLSDSAYAGAAQGYAGALNSANSINYAACKSGSSSCVAVAKCSDLGALLLPPVTFTVGLPTGGAVTVAKTFYLTADTASTATGVTCNAAYGDGSTSAGASFTFTATTAS